MLRRAEGCFIVLLCRIAQRVRDILFPFEMLVERRRLGTDLFGDLFHLGSVIAVLGKPRQRFDKNSFFCRHTVLPTVS